MFRMRFFIIKLVQLVLLMRKYPWKGLGRKIRNISNPKGSHRSTTSFRCQNEGKGSDPGPFEIFFVELFVEINSHGKDYRLKN